MLVDKKDKECVAVPVRVFGLTMGLFSLISTHGLREDILAQAWIHPGLWFPASAGLIPANGIGAGICPANGIRADPSPGLSSDSIQKSELSPGQGFHLQRNLGGWKREGEKNTDKPSGNVLTL